ncbi:MAG: large conductance mechanosensitive channel protein MscL [Chitinophagales bacterium]|nr:large conductance mechanosensitive channel protein MscL [Chitinophagales bacterium]
MLKEFKDFAIKGNLVDMAVAFVMGGAFATVSSSFINGLVMPPIALITGAGTDGSIVLREAVMDAAGTVTSPEVALSYGAFISAVINFIIVAFVMFMVIKAINKTKKPEAPAPPPGPTTEELLMEIRDALKK